MSIAWSYEYTRLDLRSTMSKLSGSIPWRRTDFCCTAKLVRVPKKWITSWVDTFRRNFASYSSGFRSNWLTSGFGQECQQKLHRQRRQNNVFIFVFSEHRLKRIKTCGQYRISEVWTDSYLTQLPVEDILSVGWWVVFTVVGIIWKRCREDSTERRIIGRRICWASKRHSGKAWKRNSIYWLILQPCQSS